ncbi:GGDEF domain-containing protein [Deinococcus psychrotolerans]|uniref:GGDEF domain-containing protein n=1 Tax=Deinococcus psychrotolerans TaxID=2489213 RepID=A0A3G8YBU6_9DEIO|nr:GGDEF domain-containing protein [Deinococcus psychrotolerans]
MNSEVCQANLSDSEVNFLMPTPLPKPTSLDGPKRSTYLATACCLLLFSSVRLATLLAVGPLNPLGVALSTLLLLLSFWTIWALRQKNLALPLIEKTVLLVCVGLYLTFTLQPLFGGPQRLDNAGLNELGALALAAGVYVFLPLHRAKYWLTAVLAGHFISRWEPLLLEPNWLSLGTQLTRDSVFLATLLLIVLLGNHRSAWRGAYDSAKAMRDMAHTDDLIGLPNRRAAYRYFEKAMRGAQTPVSVLLLDIDNFKRINDSHGHEAGDAALQAIAAAVQRTLGTSGVLVRWGGEEFLVLLSGITLTHALREAEALRAAVEELALPSGSVTISIGVSSRMPKDDVQELVRRADIGLYHAKTSGKNRVIAQIS